MTEEVRDLRIHDTECKRWEDIIRPSVGQRWEDPHKIKVRDGRIYMAQRGLEKQNCRYEDAWHEEEEREEDL